MNKTLRSLLLVSYFFFSSTEFNLFAQQKAADYTIRIQDQVLTPAVNAQSWLDSVKLHVKGNHSGQVILQFWQIPDAGQKQTLKSSGIQLLDFLPNLAYTAVINFPLANGLNVSSAGIRSVVPLSRDWKIDKRIVRGLHLQSEKRVDILVSFVRENISIADIEGVVGAYGGIIADRRYAPVNVFEIEIAQNKISALAEQALIKYISLPAKNTPLNHDAAASSGAMLLRAPVSSGGLGLDGSGVTIGVGDNVPTNVHIDILDRLVNFNPDQIGMHGIHTTLTVAGKGIMDPRTVGMAPSAKILGHLYNLVWAHTPAMYKDYNMTLTNNSYAAVVGDTSYSGTYDVESQALDQYSLQFPMVGHVFASGNDGLMQKVPYPPAYHTVNGSYQSAKNILTVGALAKDNVVWPKSSRGPVKDGRLKPEVVAYGFGVFSGTTFDDYGPSNGTSMSCPVVTGCMGLLEQRYKQLFGNSNAPANLLKALIMNGATDFGNPGPDFTNGYGLVNLYRSTVMLNNNQFLIDSVNHAAANTHTISVPANTAQLKVMLYWHDEPSSPLAVSTLVNNLDLEVKEPSAFLHRPLILDPSPANVINTAVEGIDNTNNSEQVVINSPAVGAYTVTIKGSSIPSGRQQYVLAYDLVPTGVKIKYPITGVPVPGNDSVRIYWDASDDAGTFMLQYSDNGGSSWSTIVNNLPSSQRQYVWYTPNISTTQAMVRILRNNVLQDQVGVFTLSPQPVVQLSANQCPGYMAIEWTSVPNASGYEVLKKIGDDLHPIDTVTTLSYVLSALAFDSMYYVGVRPLISNVRGYRSKSVKRTPNDGSCAGTISDGDLMVSAILNPNSGRKQTSSELTGNTTLSVQIRNLDDVPANSYRVSFSLNGGAWQTQLVTTPIASLGYATINFPGLNLTAVDTYRFRCAVENLATNDPVKMNDSVTKTVRQLTNDPVNLNNGFTEDFENTATWSIMKDSMGVTLNDRWDFTNSNDTGRLSSFVSSDVLISGQRSISMDQLFNTMWGQQHVTFSQNYFTGTFNLQGYDTATTEARIEFDYKLHGRPKFLEGNDVWVRGSDASQWVKIFTFDTSAIPGAIINSGSLSVTKAFTDSLQNFSSSMQVRFAQHDSSCIAMNEYGNGITFDNIKLYSVKNDVQLLSVVSPERAGCGLVGSIPLQLLVFNSDNLPQDSIHMHYRLDNGPVISELLPMIAAKDTVYFTFQAQLSNLTTGYHRLDIWLVNPGDSYLPNDSIINFQFRNQPMVDVFPYLQTFESTDGDWYSEGQNSSWEYGEPASLQVKKAASGTKVWATGLTGYYNNNEKSYLYSPCFDISGLTWPTLSFSLSTDIENCGNDLCDAAYIEYSDDGKTWTRLGANGEGTNWYGSLGVWNDTNSTRWRVASIPLPYGLKSLKLRFVMTSDAGASRDGITIDDIHVFDLKNGIYEGSTTDVTGLVNGNNTVEFTSASKVLATIIPQGTKLGNTKVTMYNHDYVFNPVVQAYHLGRNYVIQPSEATADTVIVRLFITDAEVVKLLGDNACDTCSRAEDAYRMGITKYDNDNNALENGALSDNIGGTYSFLPYTTIAWVPYDNGYYAEFSVSTFSEFWFNTAIPDKKFVGPIVFPNPIRDGKINIVWNAAPGTEMQLMMTDVTGRVVYRSLIAATDFDNRTTVQLPDLATGVYVLRYILGEQTQDLKVQVMR